MILKGTFIRKHVHVKEIIYQGNMNFHQQDKIEDVVVHWPQGNHNRSNSTIIKLVIVLAWNFINIFSQIEFMKTELVSAVGFYHKSAVCTSLRCIELLFHKHFDSSAIRKSLVTDADKNSGSEHSAFADSLRFSAKRKSSPWHKYSQQ